MSDRVRGQNALMNRLPFSHISTSDWFMILTIPGSSSLALTATEYLHLLVLAVC